MATIPHQPVGSTSQTIKSLPIIDISPFLDTSSTPEARQQTAASIDRACTEFGFFYLTGHGIPKARLEEIIALARQFFALPPEEKNKIKRRDAGDPEGGDGARGYQGIGENVTQGKRDMHEAIDLYREWDHAPREEGSGGTGTWSTLQGPNLWPSEPEELKNVYLEYIDQLQSVGSALVRAMGQALDLPLPDPNIPPTPQIEDSDIFVHNTDRSFWVMRLIGYPKLATPLSSDADITELSCGEHTDYGCVTLLLADPTPGALQVLLKDGTTWLNADPIPGAFVVNIGDMIERWTNGLWQSTRHRVIHHGEGFRVSVPFFFEPNFEAVVRPLMKCVEKSGKQAVHGGSTYGEHLLGKVFGNFYSN
ncbi:hypothetical protein N0V90_007416 [Kalmusia sp. IMI 367209]|nr:hypothetical protein N0V90_007416 [Kalmusia sp. IMI 367209]